MEYSVLVYLFVLISGYCVFGEKTIYEKILLKKNARAPANSAIPYFIPRLRHQLQNPSQFVYLYPDHPMQFPVKPLNGRGPSGKQPMPNHDMLPQMSQMALTREQYLQQHNKYKSDIIKYLPVIMKTLTAHSLMPSNPYAETKFVEVVPSSAPHKMQINHVMTVKPKPVSLFVIPSPTASTDGSSSVHRLPTTTHFQTPVKPHYNYDSTASIYKTPPLYDVSSFPLNMNNDRDYYRRPNYDDIIQPTDSEVMEVSPATYSYQYLDGGYVVSNRRGDKNTDKEDNSEFGSEGHKKHGYNTSTDFQSNSEFSKGSTGSYHNADQERFHEQDGERNSSEYQDSASEEHYSDEDSKEKGAKHKKKLGHWKDSRITGYHNVYHRDEYVKDHIFYDDADHSGHYRKYGKSNNEFEQEDSEHKDGSYEDSSLSKSQEWDQALYSQGYYDNKDSGYNNQNAKNNEYQNKEIWKKNEGRREQEIQ